MAHPDRLGVVERVEEVEGGLVFHVKFDSPEAMERAQNVARNLDRALVELWEDRVTVGIATKDFYDGP